MVRVTKKSPRGAEWELAYVDRGVLPRGRHDLCEPLVLGGDGRKPFKLTRKLEVNV